MSYTLFIDDFRDKTWELGADVLVVRSCAEAENAVCIFGLPAVISFDYDLGKGPSGLAFLQWLIKAHRDGRYDLSKVQKVIIHSANPIGAQNLQGLWDGFASKVLSNGV